jgi:hypothetical protein
MLHFRYSRTPFFRSLSANPLEQDFTGVDDNIKPEHKKADADQFRAFSPPHDMRGLSPPSC